MSSYQRYQRKESWLEAPIRVWHLLAAAIGWFGAMVIEGILMGGLG